jgi:membrane-associated phospholipid phosphatase
MRRRYISGWIIVAFISALDASWLYLSDHAVRLGSVFVACKGAGVLICVALILRALTNIHRYQSVAARLRYAEVSDTAAWCALFVSFVSVTCVLSYLCVSINAPLIENRMIEFDRALGFDWVAVYRWTQAHPHVQKILQLAYASGEWQLFGMTLILGLSGRREALSELFFLLVLGSAFLLLISTPFPATSAFVHFHIEDLNATASVSDFAILRDGSLRIIDIGHTQGLVSMPSFHTALAVLFTYSLRRIRWLFSIAVPLNVVMILSTPTQGGHYLADVIAGLLLSALTIQILNAINRTRTEVSKSSILSSASAIGNAVRERLL